VQNYNFLIIENKNPQYIYRKPVVRQSPTENGRIATRNSPYQQQNNSFLSLYDVYSHYYYYLCRPLEWLVLTIMQGGFKSPNDCFCQPCGVT